MKEDVQCDQNERLLAILHLVVLCGRLLCSDLMAMKAGLRHPEEHDTSSENSYDSIH